MVKANWDLVLKSAIFFCECIPNLEVKASLPYERLCSVKMSILGIVFIQLPLRLALEQTRNYSLSSKESVVC